MLLQQQYRYYRLPLSSLYPLHAQLLLISLLPGFLRTTEHPFYHFLYR